MDTKLDRNAQRLKTLLERSTGCRCVLPPGLLHNAFLINDTPVCVCVSVSEVDTPDVGSPVYFPYSTLGFLKSGIDADGFLAQFSRGLNLWRILHVEEDLLSSMDFLSLDYFEINGANTAMFPVDPSDSSLISLDSFLGYVRASLPPKKKRSAFIFPVSEGFSSDMPERPSSLFFEGTGEVVSAHYKKQD